MIFVCVPAFLLAGCSGGGGVKEVLESGMASEKVPPTVTSAAERQAEMGDTAEGSDAALTGEDGIDIDLSAMSSTMAYSQLYCMLISPDA